MKTAAEKKELLKEKRLLEKCGGDCKKCPHCITHFAESGRAVYFAFSCDNASYFGIISDARSTMHADLLEAISFELKEAI